MRIDIGNGKVVSGSEKGPGISYDAWEFLWLHISDRGARAKNGNDLNHRNSNMHETLKDRFW